MPKDNPFFEMTREDFYCEHGRWPNEEEFEEHYKRMWVLGDKQKARQRRKMTPEAYKIWTSVVIFLLMFVMFRR